MHTIPDTSKKDVQNFYETFDFEKIITNPPRLIQDFLEGEIKFLKRHIEPGKEILEIGCGYGRLLKVLCGLAKNVVGIDFSNKLLNKARINLLGIENASVYYMNADRMNFSEGSFDYVLCLDASFGNMPNIEQDILKEMKRVCRKGGEIVVSVFSEDAKDSQIENYTRIGLKNIKDDGIAVHTAEGFYSRRFSKKNLAELFSSIGLKCSIQSICSINYIATAKKI